jgi:hypothetical protein
MTIAQSLDHFVVPGDDLVVAEDFYARVFGGVLGKRNRLNVRQRKRGAVPHTFIQIGGKRMGVYLQSDERPAPAGAPIDYVFPEPVVPVKAVSMLALSSRPPHPHAAALLIDFMLSKKGQEIAYRQNRWPACRDLATGGPDEVGSRKTLVPDSEKWGARFEELVQLTELLGR